MYEFSLTGPTHIRCTNNRTSSQYGFQLWLAIPLIPWLAGDNDIFSDANLADYMRQPVCLSTVIAIWDCRYNVHGDIVARVNFGDNFQILLSQMFLNLCLGLVCSQDDQNIKCVLFTYVFTNIIFETTF